MTLEEELKGDDFASRGWLRLTDLTDYLGHLVDGQSTGYLKADPATHAIILRLATVLKAGTQWFADEPSDREPPRFIIEAEKYLATGPVGVPIVRKCVFRSHLNADSDGTRAPMYPLAQERLLESGRIRCSSGAEYAAKGRGETFKHP